MPASPQGDAIRLLVLGARGHLGRHVVDRLAGSDTVVGLGRDADPRDVHGRDVVVNVATSDPATVTAWASAGANAGGYVDAVPTATSHRTLAAQVLGPAQVVPGANLTSVAGDALAMVAGGLLTRPTRVDVTFYVPGRRSLLATATPGERADLVDAWLAPMDVLVDGRVVTERIAEHRRLAWFPRPVGPHHAVAVPGTHHRTLPAALPGLQTVRTALALRSSTAELVQAAGNLARWDRGADLVRRVVSRSRRGAGSTERERWAMVVEVADDAGGLVRGWAYGHDRHRLTAEVVAVLARALGTQDPGAAGGLVGPTAIVPGEGLLDTLAARTDLRWSVTRSAT